MEYREVNNSIQVPAEAGLEGFLHAIRELLKRPRLQEIKIDTRGKVSYRQYVREDQPNHHNIGIEFGDLLPSGIIRNSDVSELPVRPHENAAVVLGRMFDASALDHMHPVAFVSGAATVFWSWYQATTEGAWVQSRENIFGLQLLTDRQIPDTALILCAAYGKNAAMIDTQRAYKIEMTIFGPTDNLVEVM